MACPISPINSAHFNEEMLLRFGPESRVHGKLEVCLVDGLKRGVGRNPATIFESVGYTTLYTTHHVWDVANIHENHNLVYNVRPPSDVCWFISPSNYSYKYHKPYSYWSYVHQLNAILGASHCRKRYFRQKQWCFQSSRGYIFTSRLGIGQLIEAKWTTDSCGTM